MPRGWFLIGLCPYFVSAIVHLAVIIISQRDGMEIKKLGGIQKLGGVKRLGGEADPSTVPAMNATLATFENDVERQTAAGQRYEAQNGFEFWFAVYFKTEQQKDAFLAAMKWFAEDGRYVDGLKLAKEKGLTLPSAPRLSDGPPKERWRALALKTQT